MSRRRALPSLATAALLAGCGADAAAPASTARASQEVGIAEFEYGPAETRVRAGGSIRWANGDTAPHTATADDKTFDTGRLERGDSRSVRLERPGTYRYHCAYHRFMEATVIVEAQTNERD